jgi:hypothetical protein
MLAEHFLKQQVFEHLAARRLAEKASVWAPCWRKDSKCMATMLAEHLPKQ